MAVRTGTLRWPTAGPGRARRSADGTLCTATPTWYVVAIVTLRGGVATESEANARPGAAPWLDRDGFFRVVTGHREATELLADRLMHADLLAMFEGIGFRDGPVWEAGRASLLSMNGREHRTLRAIVASHFTPRAAERARPVAAAAAATRCDAVVPGAPFDFIGTFAAPYVTEGICDHLGVDPSQVAGVAWAIDQLAWAARDLAVHRAAYEEAMERLVGYSEQALAERAGDPADDVVGVIAAAVDDGRMPATVGSVLVASLLSAGHEPTTKQLAIMVVTLASCPHLWDAVGSGGMEAGPVVEEVLRHRSTNVCVNRRVADSFEHRDVAFREGEQVLIGLDRANHDPSVFAAPDEVDPVANRGPNLSFGFGAHHCLGAAVARVQLQEALVALSRRFECPRVVEHVEREGGGLRGPDTLRIALAPRPV